MTIRRFNYTSRKRIPRSDVMITLRNEADGGLSYMADLEFTDEFPPAASVLIEAHQQARYQRFDHGTIANPSSPAWEPLRDFVAEERPRFRVKVVDISDEGRGRLLGAASGLIAGMEGQDPATRVSLLPVEPAVLRHQAWKLAIHPSPVHQVNSKVGDWKAVAASDEFRWLVYPEAVRQVLRTILFELEQDECEDMHRWPDQWLYFALQLPGVGPLPANDRELREDWIEDVVEQFCATRKLAESGRRVFQAQEA
jgi:hypothetical protein